MMNELYDMEPITTELGVIKPITSFDDFSSVIDVFKEPPYGEPLTLEDKVEEYNGYVNNGLALGYYNYDGEIMGYIGLMEEVESEHRKYFHESVDSLHPLYVYGVATKKKFRGHGLATSLINATYTHALNEDIDFIYCRINHKGSMSERIFRANGYGDLYQNGEVVFQDISDQSFRISEETDPDGNLKRFLVMPVTEMGKNCLIEAGSISVGDTNISDRVLVKC